MPPNSPVTSTTVSAGSSCASSVGRPADHGLELHGGAHDLLGARELEEVRDDVPERLGLLTDAVDVGPVGRRQIVGANQAAVAMNRRQPVAELVGDAGGELAHRASASFSRSCSSSSITCVRSENRQMAPWLAVGRRRAATP